MAGIVIARQTLLIDSEPLLKRVCLPSPEVAENGRSVKRDCRFEIPTSGTNAIDFMSVTMLILKYPRDLN